MTELDKPSINSTDRSRQVIQELLEKKVILFIIFLVLMISEYLALKSPLYNLNSFLLLGLIVGMPFFLLFSRSPSLGLTILVVSGLLIPFSINTGSQTSVNATVVLIALLVGLWLFNSLARRNSLLSISAKIFLPILCLDLVVILSFFNGQLPWYWGAAKAPITSQIGAIIIFLFSTFGFLLVANQITEVKWLERMTWLFVIVASVDVLGMAIPPIGSITSRFFQYGSDGSLFWVWIASITVSQGILNRNLRKRWRWLLFGIAGVTFYVGLVLNEGWTSGWLPSLLSIAVILFLSFPKYRLGFLLFIVGFVLLRSTQVVGVLMAGDNQYSLTTRLAAWQIIGEIIRVSPVLGLGPANYRFYTPLFPILGYAVEFNSHNNYVDLIAQTGLLGLACFLWFASTVGRLGWEIKATIPDGFQKAYVVGALGGLVGTLVAGMFGDWVIPFVYNIGYNGFRASILAWLFLGGLVAIYRMNLKTTTK